MTTGAVTFETIRFLAKTNNLFIMAQLLNKFTWKLKKATKPFNNMDFQNHLIRTTVLLKIRNSNMCIKNYLVVSKISSI